MVVRWWHLLQLRRYFLPAECPRSSRAAAHPRRLSFAAPLDAEVEELDLVLVSDSYLGLDQRHRVPLGMARAAAAAAAGG